MLASLLVSREASAQTRPDILWIGHTNLDRINTVIFNPAGDTVISGSSDRLINFWRVADGKLMRTLNAGAPFVHESAIEWLAITRDSSRLASVTHQVVQLWTLPEGTEKRLLGHTDWVVGVSFSPDGQLLASASFDGTVRIWRASDGAFIRSISNPRQMRTVAFSPDGTLLAGAGGDNNVYLWKTSDWSTAKTLTGHANDIYVVTFSPDGTRLASGGYDKTVKVWNVATGANLYTLSGNNGNVYGIAFTPDSARLAYTDGEGSTLRVHRVSDGARLALYTQDVPEVQTLAFSPSGLLAYGVVNERVYLARIDATNSTPATNWHLTKSVTGSGTIQASPGPSAFGTYANGTVVTLQAIPSGTNRFVGWGGAVSGTATTVSVTMNGDKTVIANFSGAVPREEVVWQNVDQRMAAWVMRGLEFSQTILLNGGKPVGSGWKAKTFADFNRDQHKDCVFQHQDGRLALWLMRNDEKLANIRVQTPTLSGWNVAGAGDFSLDGKMDILLHHNAGYLAIIVMNDTNYSTLVRLNDNKALPASRRVAGVGDFQKDGRPDILLFNVDTRTLNMWVMNGIKKASASLLRDGRPVAHGWTPGAVGDVDGDGHLDILLRHEDGRVAAWLLINGRFSRSVYLRDGKVLNPIWTTVGVK